LTNSIKCRTKALIELKEAFWKQLPPSVWKDPVMFLRSYEDPKDVELVGFLAATLAFGNVSVLKGRLEALFLALGPSPWQRLCHYDRERTKLAKALSGWKYRFIPSEAIIWLLGGLARILQAHGSLEAFFMEEYLGSGEVWSASGAFLERLRQETVPKGLPLRPPILFLLPKGNASPLKRLNLFLRWMVRKDGFDHGLWKGIPKDRLCAPLDTHVFRLGRQIGLIQAKMPGKKACIQLTEAFLEACPEDPLSFDMPLSHFGMMRTCSHRFEPGVCRACPLKPVCMLAQPEPSEG
jgi:uncharacterized protein (TIGR02757 family)